MARESIRLDTLSRGHGRAVLYALLFGFSAVAAAALALLTQVPFGGASLQTHVLLGIVAGFAFFVFVLARPILALGVFALLWAPTIFLSTTIRVGNISTVDVNLTRAIGAVLLGALLARLVLSMVLRSGRTTLARPLAWYFFFGFLIVVAFLRSARPLDALPDMLRFATGALTMLVLWRETRSESDVWFLHACLTAGAACSSVLTILTYISAGPLYLLVRNTGRVTRAIGALGAPNSSANMAVLGIALLLAAVPWFRRHPRHWWLFIGGLVVNMGAIAVALSRGAILALIVFFALWLAYDRGATAPLRVRLAAFLVCAAALPVVLALTGATRFAERLTDVPGVGTTLQDTRAGSGRVGLWVDNYKELARGSASELVFGRGLGSSLDFARYNFYIQGSRDFQGPHNEYLWLVFETGLLGLAAYVVFLTSMVQSFWRGLRANLFESRRALISGGLCFLGCYQLAIEMLAWGVTEVTVRWYMLVFVVLALVSAEGFAASNACAPQAGHGLVRD